MPWLHSNWTNLCRLSWSAEFCSSSRDKSAIAKAWAVAKAEGSSSSVHSRDSWYPVTFRTTQKTSSASQELYFSCRSSQSRKLTCSTWSLAWLSCPLPDSNCRCLSGLVVRRIWSSYFCSDSCLIWRESPPWPPVWTFSSYRSSWCTGESRRWRQWSHQRRRRASSNCKLSFRVSMICHLDWSWTCWHYPFYFIK